MIDKKNNHELVEEYRKRYIRWTDRTLSQLSFFNNLVLTLAVGFLTFGYNLIKFQELKFSFFHPDFSFTLLVFSLLSICFSILIGILVAINRLYDFRITSQINGVRKMALELTGTLMPQSTCHKFNVWKRLKLIFTLLKEDYPKITIEDCKNLETLNEKINDFKRLRSISHNLGLSTWYYTKLQIYFFFFGFLSYTISIII